MPEFPITSTIRLWLKNYLPHTYNILLYARLKCKSYIFSRLYSGFNFECNFCHGRFCKLLPTGRKVSVLREKKVIGAGYRKNAICPRCGSKDRERLIYLYFTKKTDILLNRYNVLHIAPEESLKRVLTDSPKISYVSGDLYDPDVMVRMNIEKIPFADDSFDIILCNHVLEHVNNDKQAIAELFRVMRPGGWGILQVPIASTLSKTDEDKTVTNPRDREKRFGQEDHVRLYAQRNYKERLRKAGFHVTLYDATSDLGMALVKYYALCEKEKLYICAKPKT